MWWIGLKQFRKVTSDGLLWGGLKQVSKIDR